MYTASVGDQIIQMIDLHTYRGKVSTMDSLLRTDCNIQNNKTLSRH